MFSEVIITNPTEFVKIVKSFIYETTIIMLFFFLPIRPAITVITCLKNALTETKLLPLKHRLSDVHIVKSQRNNLSCTLTSDIKSWGRQGGTVNGILRVVRLVPYCWWGRLCCQPSLARSRSPRLRYAVVPQFYSTSSQPARSSPKLCPSHHTKYNKSTFKTTHSLTYTIFL